MVNLVVNFNQVQERPALDALFQDDEIKSQIVCNLRTVRCA